jgi:tetratricopeptide (TPR) repeat protein
MLALVRDAGDGEIIVPPTIQALLAARLDQLDSSERSVLERGSVEGRVFHRGAVQALVPEEQQVMTRLTALVRKELVRPDKPQLPGEDAFRFRHLLIRDAAYDALPKATRAELHERFAAWLEERGADLVELDEILGHHLEQAVRYKAELGQTDLKLAERAGEHLAAAGRRALWRGDELAAASLLERALELTRPIQLDVHLELDLTRAFGFRDPRRAAAIAGAAGGRARAAGDDAGEALAHVVGAHLRTAFEPDPPIDELEALARAALPVLERAGDHAGLVHVWYALGFGVANIRGRFGDRVEASKEAIRHSRLAGERWTDLFVLEPALFYGPQPADDALRTLDALLPSNPHPRLLLGRALLVAMLGRFEEAWRIGLEAANRWRELTDDPWAEGALGAIATLADDHEAAARYSRTQCDVLEERGQRAFLSTFAPRLGRSLCALRRYDEAEPLAQLGRELGDEQDAVTQMLWRQVQAVVLAHRGDYRPAETLAREAVAITEQTDSLNSQGDALCDLAEVLAAPGRTGEAATALKQALERYERKKNLAMVAQVRPKLEAIRAAVS